MGSKPQTHERLMKGAFNERLHRVTQAGGTEASPEVMSGPALSDFHTLCLSALRTFVSTLKTDHTHVCVAEAS